MYSPPLFRETRPEVLHAFIRAHVLGTIVSAGTGGLEASHIPMFLDTSVEPPRLRCHFARANTQWQSLAEAAPVLVLFQESGHYISPSWYPSKAEHGKAVPTWNYAAVHVSGAAHFFDDPREMLNHLAELTGHNEASVAGSWKVTDAPPAFIEKMTRAIIGCEITISRIEGTFKLGQNRSRADREGSITGLDQLGSFASLRTAELMKKTLDD